VFSAASFWIPCSSLWRSS